MVTALWVAVILGYTTFRSLRQISSQPSVRQTIGLTVEAAIMAAAVASTGYFSSSLAFSTLTAVAVSGFLAGFAASLRLAAATAFAVGLPWILTAADTAEAGRTTLQWTAELLLVGVVTSYARRIASDVEEGRSAALDRLGRLGDANDLLFNLHQVAQDLPSSFDLEEVLDSTVSRLRDLFELEAVAIVLLEETDQTWHVARRFGARTASAFDQETLPTPLREAADAGSTLSYPNLMRAGGPGVTARAGSGVYAALVARGALVGVIAIEHSEPFQFDTRDTELLDGFAEPAALAIDNARWFARLRTVGADEERTRIARDLHDRIGQSLAYLAFELDRIVRKDERGDAVADDLREIREDVRGVVREVRDTLYDLRTDVSEHRTVGDVLTEFATRIEERSGIAVNVRIEETDRLPQLQERELWRIAQEAMVNAERHSKAKQISVRWISDGTTAMAEIADDGTGMPAGRAGRLDSYGLLGMRERAASIGATLSVDSTPSRGVTVRVVIEPTT